MILLIHITAAVSSLALTAYLYFRPSKVGLQIDYALVGTMLVTGFYLILSKPAHMTQTCIEGLVYLAIVSYGMVVAHHKLALKKSE